MSEPKKPGKPKKNVLHENFQDHIIGAAQFIHWTVLAWYRFVKETWPLWIGVIVIASVAIYFADPAPPQKVTFASGTPGGSYQALAEQYKAYLAQYDIEVEVIESTGPYDNLQRMIHPGDGPRIDVAFVQSGLAHAVKGIEQLAYLGSVDYEPIFFLLRKDKQPTDARDFIQNLPQLRLGMGEPGTGTKVQFERLLALNNRQSALSNFVVQSDRQSVSDVLAGKLDGIVLVDGIQSPNMQALLDSSDVVLLSPSRVQAYHRLLPYLQVLTIPEGSISLTNNIPARDLPILSTTTQMVVQADLHPALQFLLLKAAAHVSGSASFFAKQDTFPTFTDSSITRSPIAQEYFLKGSPYFDRHLPFWLAELLDRFIFILMPFLAIIYPLLWSLPSYRKKRLDYKIWLSYGKLKALELEISDDFDPDKAQDYLKQLDQIESDAVRVKIYGSQGAEYFKHRQHIHFVRSLLYRHIESDSAAGHRTSFANETEHRRD